MSAELTATAKRILYHWDHEALEPAEVRLARAYLANYDDGPITADELTALGFEYGYSFGKDWWRKGNTYCWPCGPGCWNVAGIACETIGQIRRLLSVLEEANAK